MITNSWENIKLVCGNHETNDVEMKIQAGSFSLFYACPKYQESNRQLGDKICANRLNLVDYEKMLNYINDLIMDADERNIVINLTNTKWTTKGITYEILQHNPDSIIVKVLNKKSLTNIKKF